jgi:hypothetical protein
LTKGNPTRILFLTSDPSDVSRLRLGQELRDIREKLQLSKQRNDFLLESRESVRPSDITQAIFDLNPQIIHFSGHGTQEGYICFENIEGKVQPVSPNALAALFSLVSSEIQCVILNACYSEIQAKAISEHIPFVIGMNKEIGDKAAILFSTGFYKALGAGHIVENAYKFGCVEIQLNGIQEHITPVIHAQETQDTINTNTPALSTFHNEKDKQLASMIFLMRLGKSSKDFWTTRDGYLYPNLIPVFQEYCSEFFEIARDKHRANVDPSFDITLVNELCKTLVIHKLGIEIVSVANHRMRWMGSGHAQAAKIVLQASYISKIPDVREKISREFGGFPIFLKPTHMNLLIPAEMPDPFRLEPGSVFRYEILLEKYIKNMPNLAVIRFWVETQEMKYNSDYIYLFTF